MADVFDPHAIAEDGGILSVWVPTTGELLTLSIWNESCVAGDSSADVYEMRQIEDDLRAAYPPPYTVEAVQ